MPLVVMVCGTACAPLVWGKGDEVLVPAYHHGSEIEALVRAGVKCRFYEASETLEPVTRELEAALTPRTRALLIVHYIGFPQDSDRWRRWCDEHGLLLLEDAAQAWLASASGRPVGSFGDLSVFCLYKTFGFPDGSALVTAASTPEIESGSSRGGPWALPGLHFVMEPGR